MSRIDDIEARAYPFGTRKPKRAPEVVVAPEGMVVNACIRWLHAHGVFGYRNNSGAYKPEGSNRYIRYGYPGSPDILGLLPKNSQRPGAFFGIEAKSAVGRQTENQIAFQRKIEESGGIYIVARSTDDLEIHLRPLLTL